jgi:tungstate transport system ATP-binding protein
VTTTRRHASDIVLGLRDIEIHYPPTVRVDVPALEVRAGETLALMGPNGSGKSSVLRVMALLQAPSRGSVSFQGRPVAVAHALEARRRMAIVFQQPLLANMTVEDNVAMGLRFRGVPRHDARARVTRWLSRLAIEHLAGRRSRTLSGGEAQRVSLARALVLEPDVLMLDEPFSALDAPTRAALVPELRAILRAEGVTTILVTHDRGEAQALSDRAAVLIGGRMLQVDDTARLFSAPASDEVARFLGVGPARTGPGGGGACPCCGRPQWLPRDLDLQPRPGT